MRTAALSLLLLLATGCAPGAQGTPESVSAAFTVEAGQRRGGPERVEAARGARVVIEVSSDAADEVHLHGYDLSAVVAPGSPGRLEFTADLEGAFALELHGAGVELATVLVGR